MHPRHIPAVLASALLATALCGTVLKVRPCEKVDEWSYRPGSGQFITILQFEQGKLVSIRYGDRIP